MGRPAPEPAAARPFPWGVLVGACAVAVYVHTLGHGFSYDDDVVVVRNELLRSWSGVLQLFSSTEWSGAGVDAKVYRPLTGVTYALNRALAGPAAWSFHLVNVALHAAVSVLVFRLGKALGLSVLACGVAGLLFAVHPLHVESVANVSGRKDVLATLFVVATVLSHRWAVAGPRVRSLAPIVLYACAVLSKEIGVVAPALAVLLERASPGAPPLRAWLERSSLRRRAPLYLGYAGVAIAYLLAFGAVTRSTFQAELLAFENPAAVVPTGERLLTAVAVIGKGLLLWVLPTGQSPDYGFDAIPIARVPWDPRVLASVAVLAAWGWLAVRLRHRAPIVGVALGWTAVALLPTSNLLFPIGTIFGDRLLYLPSVALALLSGAAAAALLGLAPRPARVAAVALWAAALGAATVSYAAEWSDDLRLFAAAARRVPASATVHLKLAGELLKAQRPEEAIASARQALAIAPRLFRAQVVLAEALRTTGRPQEAAAVLADVLRAKGADADAAYCMGLVARDEGRLDDAGDWWTRALEVNPRHAESLESLALLDLARGRSDEALSLARRALSSDPGRAAAWYVVTSVLAAQGDAAAARRALERLSEVAGPELGDEVERLRRLLAP